MDQSKLGKSVYLKVGVWLNSETGHIHMTAPDVPGFHTTVNDKPGSVRCHANLYMKLARALKAGGAPYPELRTGEEEDA